MNHSVRLHGFEIVPGVLTPADQRELVELLGPVSGAGCRGAMAIPAVAGLARSPKLLGLVRAYLPAKPQAVRAIYFDKSSDANWLVPWHQDLTVALRERVETPDFGPWSTKNGVPNVQPPVQLLDQMLTIRLHLDDADASNGALRVLPGSHCHGRLSAGRIQDLREEQPDFLCRARAGDALLMRPLLLHASSRSSSGGHRRVLHIEYAGFTLPAALQWHEATV